MSKNLVIVESPAKAKTIERYLGRDFQVLASYGHVRDLIPKEGAVDPEHNFAMKYQLIEKNRTHLEKIAKAVKKASALYLATDPDREGEAISWHVHSVLEERGLLDDKEVNRVVFHEITKRAIQDALNNPRELSEHLINAQQARRALDNLYGFNLSPLLWKLVPGAKSAGRVQSPALRLIVEREDKISAFKSREYWTIGAIAEHEKESINARLAKYGGERTEQFSFTDEKTVRDVERIIKETANGILTVANVEKKQRRRNPAAPFTTSTLQQEASRKLGFSAQKTMMTAQRLYQGIDVGDESVGLITYMRTDSVTLAGEAIAELRTLIEERYGQESLPDKPRTYTTKARNAQEAHEAVRPTSAARIPAELKSRLDSDQYRLYELIWKRTVACQMSPAVFDTVRLDLIAGKAREGDISFRATGSVLVKPGYMILYQEGTDDTPQNDQDRVLPPLKENDQIALKEFVSEQHFTEPPPRYSEATLVKALEEYGIGRPSTYANIISTLRGREYVEMESRRFIPTEVGKVLNRFLTEYFSQYVDYEFTARMEDSLDAVSRGEGEWIPVLQDFWKPFNGLIEHTETSVTREQASQARSLGDDPKTGRPMTVRMARYGPVIQIGTKDDEEKPLFAGLRPGQKMDTITREEALELFKLPRQLGSTPDGDPVSANIGRFGPYVRYGDKFVSIKEDDPYTIALPRALEVIEEKKILDAKRLIQDFPDAGIRVLDGRYGPYVTDGKKNARVPKEKGEEAEAIRARAEKLTLDDCKAMIDAAPERKGRRGFKKARGKKKTTASKRTTTSKKTPARKASRKKAKKASRKKTAAKKSAPESSQTSPAKVGGIDPVEGPVEDS